MPKVGIKVAIDNCPLGASFPEGWVSIKDIQHSGKLIDFTAEFYASEESFDGGYLPVCTKKYTIEYLEGDVMSLIFSHLKGMNVNEYSDDVPSVRLKCNMLDGQLLTRADATLPQAQKAKK